MLESVSHTTFHACDLMLSAHLVFGMLRSTCLPVSCNQLLDVFDMRLPAHAPALNTTLF